MRILFTSPWGPRPLVDGRDPLDPFTGQLSPSQGPYAITLHGHYWAYYLMAENLNAECCVLEHPTRAEFEAELRRGYDLLGLQLNWNTLRDAAEMIACARTVAPATKIVLGGYALPQVLDPLPADRAVADVIRAGTDHYCREEGVRFMRRLIGDTPIDRPITQFTLPRSGGYLAALGPAARTLVSHPVLVALGCPAGCDFCNTSAFFHRKKLQVAEPEHIRDVMRHHLRADAAPYAQFELFDEDFFWEPDFSRRLGGLLRDDPETRSRAGYFTFGSVRTLSRLDPEELVANGLASVWIGVESTLDDALRPGEHLGKRKGRELATLFRDLREVGVQIIGSLILGFDFHTPANVAQDVDAFVGLDPAISQVTPLVPCAGTPLYDRLKEAGRLDPAFGWTASGSFQDHPPMAPQHFTWEGLRQVIDDANRRLYLETGPSALKTLDVALRGHLRLRSHADPLLRARAQHLGNVAQQQYPVLEAILAHPPSAAVADRARDVRERWRESFGAPDETLVQLGHAFAERIRAHMENPPAPPTEVKAPTRWTWYRPGEPPRVHKQAA
ncbi:MAG: hypothetical protein U0807_12215 [Candidatus Binatia bacterium]